MKLFSPEDPRLLEKLEELEEEEGQAVSVSETNPSWSPLHWFAASNDGCFLSAQARVVRGLDPNVQDVNGDTALHVATWRQSEEKVEWLLALGARRDVVNLKGNLPCHQAFRKKNASIAEKLMAGIDLAQADNKGVNAIGHWVENVGRNQTRLFSEGSADARVWEILCAADRIAWSRWQDKLPPVFLAALRSYRLETMEGCLPSTAIKSSRPRF
jgi:ankyrin repeat protein